MNGIIIDGKVYEAVPIIRPHCEVCDFFYECVDGRYSGICATLKELENSDVLLRFSQELTDKIKKL